MYVYILHLDIHKFLVVEFSSTYRAINFSLISRNLLKLEHVYTSYQDPENT